MEGLEPRAAEQESVARPLTIALALLAGLCRVGTWLVPYLSNLNLVGGLGLFGGARLKSWRAYAVPLGILLVTNALLAWLQGRRYFFDPILLFVYISFLVYVFLGRYVSDSESALKIGGISLLGSLQFFVITNFGTWLVWSVDPAYAGALEPGQYPRTLAGLVACYVSGLPFLPRTVLGDLLCTGTLFGLHAILSRVYFPAERVHQLPVSVV
jgi:hypothetical protein